MKQNKNRLIFFCSILWLTLVGNSFAESLVLPPYAHSHGIRKATQKHLTLFLPTVQFDDPQGIAATKLLSRDDTTTAKDDDEVVVYGVNSGKGQIIYNTSMWALDTYGSVGSGKDQFKNPKGICCDQYGNVYVADAGNNRIVHLFIAKKTLSWVNSFNGIDGSNNGTTALQSPAQVGLDGAGLVYVSDSGNHRIVIFDSFGQVIRVITGLGSQSFVHGPTTLAISDGRFVWSYFKNERAIFCADENGRRLWKFDFRGKAQKIMPMPGNYIASYAATDYYDNLWVTDQKNHCILKFDRDLTLLDVFGSLGKDINQFVEPRGIAIWKHFGQTFIAERGGAQYFWLGTDLKNKTIQLVKTKNKQEYSLTTDLTEYSYLSLLEYQGMDTSVVIKQKFVPSGLKTNLFEIPDSLIKPNSGFVLRLEATYSSLNFNKWDYPLSIENQSVTTQKKPQ